MTCSYLVIVSDCVAFFIIIIIFIYTVNEVIFNANTVKCRETVMKTNWFHGQ